MRFRPDRTLWEQRSSGGIRNELAATIAWEKIQVSSHPPGQKLRFSQPSKSSKIGLASAASVVECFKRYLQRSTNARSKNPADLCLIRSRLHPMRPAEGRKKVVQGSFVGEVQNRESHCGPRALRVEEVVAPDSERQNVAGRGPRRIVIVVFGARRKNVNTRRAVRRRITACNPEVQ